MNQSTTQTTMRKIACLFMFTYMVSYITRINYGAVISEMVSATSLSKSTLSLALTGSFITYGAGQIISGICGDHFAPKKLVMYGLILSSAMNLLIPLCTSSYQMLAVWSINGFGQAFMWPPMVRMMTMLLSAEDYKKACVTVSWGSSFGTILVYLLSPLLIGLSGWKTVFVCSAVCGIVMIFIWNRLCPVIPTQSQQTADQGISICSDDPDPKRNTYTEGFRLFSPLMLGIMFAIILQGVLRDGVATWMPSYISETYHLGSKISILTGIVLPIFSIISFFCTKCRAFCTAFCCAHRMYAWCEPDIDLHDTALFQEVWTRFHCIRCAQCLYLCGQCHFHLWHSPVSRNKRMAHYYICMVCGGSFGHNSVPVRHPAVA